MRRPFASTATLLFVLTWCAPAIALNPRLDVSQYAHTTWRVRDGFVKGAITSLAQTPDGYLWLGTELGLLRFDGVRAVPWQPPPGQRLPGSLITTLLSAHDGTLWIGTFNGIASWKDGKLTQLSELADQEVTALLEARDGTLWVGSYAQLGGKLCDIRNEVVHCETLASGIKALYEDSRRTLWVGASNGFCRWRPGTPEFFSVPNEPFGIISFAEDGQGHLLFGSHTGVKRLVDGHFEPYLSSGSPNRWQVTQMLPDHDGGLWVGTAEHGLVHIQKRGNSDAFSHLDGLSGDYVTRFLEDREGNIWVATFDGIDRFREYAGFTITTKQRLSSDTAWSVLASKDGSVWIATDAALNHWENGQISLFGNGAETPKSDGKLDGRSPLSLFQDSLQRIWVSNTVGEVGYLQGNHFIPMQGLPSGLVRSIAEVPSGHIWIANQQAGLFELFEGRVEQHIPWAELGHKDFAKVIIADPTQRGLWLGFNQGGIAYFVDGKVRAFYSTQNGLGEGGVTDLRFGTHGALWAATAGGLSRIKDGHVATVTNKNGLPCDKVVSTVEDNDDSTWLYLACGMVRITQAELDDWVADPNRVLKATLFDISDGVRSHAASQPVSSIAKSTNGKIWFLPWDGVSVIDPHRLAFNKIPPPVHIEKVVADGKEYNISSRSPLPPHVRDLSIDYTALSLVVPEKVHFRVKLEGQDKDWRELVNVRHVDYTNLSPRHYRFRVLACNNSGVWNETGASLDFSIAPAYYQTTWFCALCVATFAGLLWVLYLLRLHQLRRQFAMGLEERVGERLRIARELHDTLLQSFQAVMIQFQAARNMVSRKPEDAVRALDEAISATAQAIAEGRDTIGGLRPDPVVNRDFAELLNAAGQELAVAQNAGGRAPSFRVVVEGAPRTVSNVVQDEVFRISREALRNAFLHAAASHIEAEVHYDKGQLRLRIRDDGKGIDPKIVAAGGRSGHWGIPGILERAKRIGSRLEFWSEEGAGTEVELVVPAAIAYEKARDGRRFRLFRRAANDGQRS